jgi:hypothetical protein
MTPSDIEWEQIRVPLRTGRVSAAHGTFSGKGSKGGRSRGSRARLLARSRKVRTRSW